MARDRKPALRAARPFTSASLRDKFDRLLVDFPHLTTHFDGQLNSIWCLAQRDRAAARRASKKQRGAA